MNPIFKHGPSAQHRLVLALLCSAILIFTDHKMASFEPVRGYLQSFVSPLQYIASTPKQMLVWAGKNLVTRKQLIADNQSFQIDILNFNEQLMELQQLKDENARLRALLASPLRPSRKKMVAEILAVNNDPYGHKIVINRGKNDGVYEGQPVLDDSGIVGQILHVGANSSRVILLTDMSHAIPVRIKRNGVRLVASGTGRIDRLTLNHVPHSTDIEQGDLIVTSGLGGKYPEGYPVAKIITVVKNDARPFARVMSKPVANIDRIRYLLLLWPDISEQLLTPTKSLDKTEEKANVRS